MADQTADILQPFSDPDAVTRYAQGPRRFVPGFADLHRMSSILLSEHAPPDAQVLVVGAGGGLELQALAQMHPQWSFVGVDPAAEMLQQAVRALGPLASRARLHHGYIDDAPAGPFDAATCLLTLHFLDADERRRTLGEIRRRLKHGAAFVAAHSSFPQQGASRALWLSRYAAYAIASGADPAEANNARAAVEARLPLLSPEQDEALLREAGFVNIEMFYTAFTWRGWVAQA